MTMQYSKLSMTIIFSTIALFLLASTFLSPNAAAMAAPFPEPAPAPYSCYDGNIACNDKIGGG
ncbi:hypothetical protein BGX29_007625 [Mortierella sp. GBA35]|nr:hypothetical protein BGX29_007625 [Mortierella sp. GBA35]